MLYREIIAVCSQIHKKHINTLCGQNVEILNAKLAVHNSKRSALNCSNITSYAHVVKQTGSIHPRVKKKGREKTCQSSLDYQLTQNYPPVQTDLYTGYSQPIGCFSSYCNIES